MFNSCSYLLCHQQQHQLVIHRWHVWTLGRCKRLVTYVHVSCYDCFLRNDKTFIKVNNKIFIKGNESGYSNNIKCRSCSVLQDSKLFIKAIFLVWRCDRSAAVANVSMRTSFRLKVLWNHSSLHSSQNTVYKCRPINQGWWFESQLWRLLVISAGRGLLTHSSGVRYPCQHMFVYHIGNL